MGVTTTQPSQDEWLGSAPALEFRMRVALLAVLYGDGRGVDPRGLPVKGQRIGEAILAEAIALATASSQVGRNDPTSHKADSRN